MELDGKEIKAQVWDIAGQECFRAVTSNYYRGAVGALVVYDITRRTTFDSIKQWLDELKSNTPLVYLNNIVDGFVDNGLFILLVGGLLAVGSNLACAYLQENNFKSLEKLYYATGYLF
ncbi:unnamed protein product [Camellia sinensis]